MKKWLKKSHRIRKESVHKGITFLYLENSILKDYPQLFKIHFEIGDLFKFEGRGNHAFESFMVNLNNTLNSINPFFLFKYRRIYQNKIKNTFSYFL